MKTPYDAKYFDEQSDGSLQSALHVLPAVIDFVHPQSVLDVGCGVGTWLRAFQQLGIADVLGVDGDYVDIGRLRIEAARFNSADLEQPVDLGRRFDLVMSLEVAEHIDRQYADTFVDTLIRHGDRVLFSAAIPGQGGTHHVNEQWPEYWIGRFAARGFTCLDPFRERLWHDDGICVCYRQNLLLFVRSTVLKEHEAQHNRPFHHFGWSLVHPKLLHEVLARPVGLRRIVREFPAALLATVRSRIYSVGLPSRRTGASLRSLPPG
jgi:SAM-dependent methyltransferase